MTAALRIVDANFNRAREALRVMEEAARFLLEDADLTREIKQLRHDLTEAVAPLSAMIAWRNTPGDVGTRISTEAEEHRHRQDDVIAAAASRLTEALRAIEEYAKTLPQVQEQEKLAGAIEAIRYRSYTAQQQLMAAMGSGRARQWRLCLLVSEDLCAGRDWLAVTEAAIGGGVDCVQLREKALEGGELLHRARELVTLCRGREVAVVINDRPDIALLAGADGVHLGQHDLPIEAVRRLAGFQLLVGMSTANLEQARAAVAAGADYCGVGPMFATTTKEKNHISGPPYLRQFREAFTQTPHLAVGGISPDNVEQVVVAGAAGVAVSSAICAAEDPATVAAALRGPLDRMVGPVDIKGH